MLDCYPFKFAKIWVLQFKGFSKRFRLWGTTYHSISAEVTLSVSTANTFIAWTAWRNTLWFLRWRCLIQKKKRTPKQWKRLIIYKCLEAKNQNHATLNSTSQRHGTCSFWMKEETKLDLVISTNTRKQLLYFPGYVFIHLSIVWIW